MERYSPWVFQFLNPLNLEEIGNQENDAHDKAPYFPSFNLIKTRYLKGEDVRKMQAESLQLPNGNTVFSQLKIW